MNRPRLVTKNQLAAISEFLTPDQFWTLHEGISGEESQFFIEKIAEFHKRIVEMPTTGQQDGKGEAAVYHLHYFFRGCDWYIMEKDIDSDKEGQIQAFGLANFGHGAELGYISIQELVENGVELDLHFTPCTRAELKRK